MALLNKNNSELSKSTWLQKVFSSLNDHLFNWLNPIKTCQHEVDRLTRCRKEALELYEMMASGSSASFLLQAFHAKAASDDLPKDQAGMACLLLSHYYTVGIHTENCTLQIDAKKAAEYRRKAVALLGDKPKFSPRALHYMRCIKRGGEAQYAFQELANRAKQPETLEGIFANKVLSYSYRKGINNEGFSIRADASIANHYGAIAATGFGAIGASIKRIVNRLNSAWFNRAKALGLIKQLADDQQDAYAQFIYARQLRRKGLEDYRVYLETSARKHQETPVTIEHKGYTPAKSYILRKFFSQTQNTYEVLHYRYQLAKQPSEEGSKYLKEILDAVNRGDSIATLQAAWYYLTKDSCSPNQAKAEKYFKEVSLQAPFSSLSEYGQQLYQKISTALATHYENLFLTDPTSRTQFLSHSARNALQKAIFYFQQVPRSSKNFCELQSKIAHYQHYFLKLPQEAVDSYSKASSKGDQDSAFRAIFFGFKLFWDQQKKKLSAADKDFVTAFEEKNSNSFDCLRPREQFVSEIGPLQTLDKIINQLIIRSQCKQSNQKLMAGIFDLKQLLKNLETDDQISTEYSPGVMHLLERAETLSLTLGEEFKHAIGKHQRVLQSHSIFFSFKEKKMYSMLSLLHALQNLLLIVTSVAERDPTHKYYQLLADSVHDFAIYYVKEAYGNLLPAKPQLSAQ